MRGGWRISVSGFLAAALLLLVSCGKEPSQVSSPPRSKTPPETRGQVKAPETAKSRQRPDRRHGAEIGRFRRGMYSDPQLSALGGGPREVQTLVEGDPELDARLEKLLAKTGPGAAKRDCLEALAEAANLPSTKLPGFIENLLRHPDPEVRARAIAELGGIADPGILPVLERALDDADPEVRLETVEVIDRGGLTDASSILTKALGDDDPNVRQLGLHVGLSQTPLVRQALVSKAAASPHADVALTALSVMEAEPDKRNIPYFTAALSHPDLTVRDQARETLALTFHELFQSAEGARTWWAANQHRYSQNLVEEIVAPGGL